MEVIQSVELIRGKRKITFFSGWTVWLKQSDIPSFPLTEGTEVERNSFEKFIQIHQYPNALDRAVKCLAERPRSRKEIECRLNAAHFDASVTELVLYKLEMENLLDDREFAEQWALSRSRKYGASRIRSELKNKGIDPEAIEAAMNNCYEDDQMDRAEAFAMKKISSMHDSCDPHRMKQRILSALVRRGYSWDIAAKAYRKAIEKNQ